MGVVNTSRVAKFLACITLLICRLSFADKQYAGADKILETFFQQHAVSGLSVSVAKEGKIIWHRGLGYADLEQMVEVDPANTKFRVASIAKVWTATALMTLVQAGKLDLNDEPQKHVPDFPKKKYPFTIDQVASHLSGIRHYRGEEPFSNLRNDNPDEALDIFKQDPLLARPGEKQIYSSYGYLLLGKVIENISHKSYHEYLTEAIFEPFGMNATVPDDKRKIIPHRGRYYTIENERLVNEINVDNLYKLPTGGYLSTSDDLVRFGIGVMSHAFLNDNAKKILWTNRKALSGEEIEFGLGWRIVDAGNGDIWIGHGGGIVGGTSNFWIFPEHQLVIAAASNLSNLNYGSVLLDLRNYFIRKDP
ncbi:Penicillin-binding protein 4* [Thalassocella blandensis]|nr:Penicillin-binding protein 4* [Thalassocella blandensis]